MFRNLSCERLFSRLETFPGRNLFFGIQKLTFQLPLETFVFLQKQTFFLRVSLFPPTPPATQAAGFETDLFNLKTNLLNTRTWRHRIDVHSAWQAWHLWHWAALGSRLAQLSPRLFVWQAWHLATSACTLCGRRGTWRH